MQSELMRPIIGIENRTAQEVFDIMCDRIRSALSAQVQDVAGWQPIETAPKDGTYILCVCMKTKPGLEKHIGTMAVDAWKDRYQGFGQFNAEAWPATHWMHLPAAPAKQ